MNSRESTPQSVPELAPRFHPRLAAVYDKAREGGHANRATIEVARKLVAYLMAVDRSGRAFQLPQLKRGGRKFM